MPPIRIPLGSISGNVPRGHELTPYERRVIIGSSISSKMLHEIELATSHSRKAVRGTIALAAFLDLAVQLFIMIETNE